jgi:hypothetical protein
MNCFVTFEGNLERWKGTVVMFSSYFGIHIYFYFTAAFLSTNTLTHCSTPHPPQYWQFVIQLIPLYYPKTNHLYCQWQQHILTIIAWSFWHRDSYLENDTTGHRTLGAVIEFCISVRVKMTSIMCNNRFKSWQLHRWWNQSLCLWILSVHCHIHKPFSLNLKSNQIEIHRNINIPAMLTSLNWLLSFKRSD